MCVGAGVRVVVWECCSVYGSASILQFRPRNSNRALLDSEENIGPVLLGFRILASLGKFRPVFKPAEIGSSGQTYTIDD